MTDNEHLLPNFEMPAVAEASAAYLPKPPRRAAAEPPPNLAKAVALPVPDFADPSRRPSCLEVDFPIAPINALSTLEGNAGKPIYQMSKWWARRRSSVFRSLLISAATAAPDDPEKAAREVWEHYYANHQKRGAFRHLRVLDPFMGGGTTLVEGARLGFDVVGMDLNPVAWFVCRNELACSDPAQVKALFAEIEAEVRPLVQPFYATSCPRGHTGRWVRDADAGNGGAAAKAPLPPSAGAPAVAGIHEGSGESATPRRGAGQSPASSSDPMPAGFDPLELPPEERAAYRWEGPEVIYTFWAKHGPCKGHGCGHHTPVFASPVVAEKTLSTDYLPLTCPSCGTAFHAELGETRMAPGAERVVLPSEPRFTEISQAFANDLNGYGAGDGSEKRERALRLLERIAHEPGLRCPQCGTFTGGEMQRVLEGHAAARRTGDIQKKHLGLQKTKVSMTLLIHPDWLRGAPGQPEGWGSAPDPAGEPLAPRTPHTGREASDAIEPPGVSNTGSARHRLRADGKGGPEGQRSSGGGLEAESPASRPYGGYAGAEPEATAAWYERRLEGLRLIEVRGAALPPVVTLADGSEIRTDEGTVPKGAHVACGACGLQQALYECLGAFGHTGPVAAYALQGHCPECAAAGYTYNGRWFKAPDAADIARLAAAEREWAARADVDLDGFWPRQEIAYAHMTHQRQPLPQHGYTHWWTMFHPRQLLVHTQLLRAITAAAERWPLDVCEQALGAFQQYLQAQSMMCWWNIKTDRLAVVFSTNDLHPKALTIEGGFPWAPYGHSRWASCARKVPEALQWSSVPYELLVATEGATSTTKVNTGDPLPGVGEVHCGSSTDLAVLGDRPFDLVITDPPFGNNLYYADLADFFYVWLRLPLLRWYDGLPERAYFVPERTPHAVEAIDNPAEHPDDREPHERERFLTDRILPAVQARTGDPDLAVGQPNPLYRAEPSGAFYCSTLTACWAEAHRLLKPGGLLAFTFHHSEDEPWLDVLESLFDAGYILVATYPIRSDESKGESAQFGSKKIEYDIIHVCRKRHGEPEAVSYARMRRWVKEETARLKTMLEHTHGGSLPESDLRVILRGKALEFYSRHYGQVYTGAGEVLGVRDALLGINQLIDDLTEEDLGGGSRAPEAAEPATRLFLRVFRGVDAMSRDDLGKTLRGTGLSQADFEARGWLRSSGRSVEAVPVAERFAWFTASGRTRKVLKTDLDQAHFLIGAALPDSKVDIGQELDRGALKPKDGVDAILTWFADTATTPDLRQAATLAADLLAHWRTRAAAKPEDKQLTFLNELGMEVRR